jgi:phosphate transport system substrate-binding protein
MSRRTRAAIAAACAATAVAAVALPASQAAAAPSDPQATAAGRPTITASGSTSVAPLAVQLARGYLRQYPRRVKFRIAQGGSDVGVADVGAGRVTIGMSSRDPKSSDPSGLIFHKVAKDAVCIVTNPANPIANLSTAQIQAIFSGSVRDWSQVPGAGVTGTINIVTRTPASGTQDAFQKIFMGSKTVGSTASAKASNGLVQQAVKDDRNAVGYVSLDFVSGTHTAAYNGVACDLRNAKSGAYGGVRNFWMVTRGPATGVVRSFINWTQNSSRAAAITGRHWVPLK